MDVRRRTNPRSTLLVAVAAVLVLVASVGAWLLFGPGARSTAPATALGPRGGPSPEASQLADGERSAGATPKTRAPDPAERAARADARVEIESTAGVSTAAVAERTTRTLAGEVRDETNGAPIQDAEVVFTEANGDSTRARTAEDGTFTLEATEQGALHVTHPRYVDAVWPRLALDAPVDLRLVPSARLYGRVVDENTRAVADCSLTLVAEGQASFEPREQSTDENGRFAFEDLAPGDYAMLLRSMTDETRLEERLQLRTDVESELVLTLTRGVTLEGRVLLRKTSAPVEAVALELTPSWDGWAAQRSTLRTQSDGEGRFELDGLSPGRWHLVARTPWGELIERDVVLPETGEPAELVLEARPAAGTVSGRVFDEGGQPVGGARVWITKRPESRDFVWEDMPSQGITTPLVAAARTDASGAFAFDGLPAREALWILAMPPQASAEERPGRFEPLRLIEGEVRSGVDLVVTPDTYFVEGVVTDEDGAPLAGVQVEGWHARWGQSSSGRTAVSGADGAFRVGPFPEGPTRVEFEADGYLFRRRGTQLRDGVAPLEVELLRAHELSGWVVDERGRGVDGVWVQARSSEVPRRTRALTDELGEFVFGRGDAKLLGTGRWKLFLSKGAFERIDPSNGVVELDLPSAPPPTFVVRPKGQEPYATVRGELAWRGDGRPILDLSFLGARGGVARRSGTSFEIHGIDPGRLKLIATAPRMEPVHFPAVTLEPDAVFDLGRVEARRASTVDVQVQDAAGKPIRGAKVRLEALASSRAGWGSQRPPIELSEGSKKGRYTSRRVPRYAWRLKVWSKGYAAHTRNVSVKKSKESYTVKLKRKPSSGG